MGSRTGAWVGVVTVVLGTAVWGCSDEPGPSSEGDTHWLAACAVDDECQRGTCLCGLCSEPCAGDAQCSGGTAAACFEVASPGVSADCASEVAMQQREAVGVCLAVCEGDADCGETQRCRAGACLRMESPDAGVGADDAGTGPVVDAGDPGVVPVVEPPGPTARATEFAALDAAVDFGEPLPLPEPERVLQAPAERLVGVWHQPRCEQSEYQDWYPSGCMSITIEATADGALSGTLQFSHDGTTEYLSPVWDFAPASDPDVGYPVEVPPEQYAGFLVNPQAGIPYALLDPRLEGDVLSFWVSPLDLWREWCAMQTAYPDPTSTETRYTCAPDPTAAPTTEGELGKLALCTARPPYTDCDGDGRFCSCEETTGERALCSDAVCRCDAAGCQADWQRRQWRMVARLEGDTLTPLLWYDSDPLPKPPLQRMEAP